ncbi:hypothetical protein [Telluribacter sp. SYSU D00476]|uniref:hypothetical protein n=1 Tax=Telluribacter sp. SYSU D00476 TaxID=2811430 RepID=UPI001FF195B5|nr:hypothetical protein [Telluribacter sp. SYSU D00476]
MKFLRYLVLTLFGFFWLAGCSRTIMQQLAQVEVLPDDYRYGDLYRLSNLPQFRDQRQDCREYTPPTKPADKKIHLYIIGDSFTEAQRVGKQDFPVDSYQYVHWADILHVKLDTTATNILLLESVERHFREHLATAPITSLVPDSATYKVVPQDPRLMGQIDNMFSSVQTEDRLELLLFQYDPILALKELKASFNYRFFDRANDKVTVSEDGRHVVYYLDTDTTSITSSYAHIRNIQVDTLVHNITESTRHFKDMGFDHVVLSIIPNKSSVLIPHFYNYNRLIERVYNHPALPIPYVDVLEDFRKIKEKSYLVGDSHWTCQGQYLWLEKVNKLILELVNTPSASPRPANKITSI